MPPIPKDEEEEENPYMALRAAKIARNQAQLQKLGLAKPTPASFPTNNTTVKKSAPKKKPSSTPPAALRRSSRLSNQPDQPDYKEQPLPRDSPALPASTRVAKRPRTTSPSNETPAPPPAANSVRSINVDIEQLVLGKDGLLGHQMEQTGKEFVIYQAFDKAAFGQDKERLQGSRLSFNKYCGVQEWNNAIFLWVNLGSSQNPVVNDFLQQGKQITWFGGSRMHDESPVIHKLIQMGKSTTNIVLWCRKYQTETKQFTPYMCFGRLGYESHLPGSQPLSFVWNLLDYSSLKDHSSQEIRSRLQYFTGA